MDRKLAFCEVGGKMGDLEVLPLTPEECCGAGTAKSALQYEALTEVNSSHKHKENIYLFVYLFICNCEGGQILARVAQRGCGISLCLEITQNPPGHGPEQPLLVDPGFEQEVWTRLSPDVPSSLHSSVML